MLLAVTTPVMASDDTAPSPRRAYSNCTELNRDYRHGVSDRRMTKQQWIRKGATDKGAYKPTLYRRVESSMDRDNDHIACEK
jgi:hypothetical protein